MNPKDRARGTLHETVASDRHLTTRNTIGWIHQILDEIIKFHRVFACTGDFDLINIRLGSDEALQNEFSFLDKLLKRLSRDKEIFSLLDDNGEEDGSLAPTAPKRKNSRDVDLLHQGDRIAVFDFRSRIEAFFERRTAHENEENVHRKRLEIIKKAKEATTTAIAVRPHSSTNKSSANKLPLIDGDSSSDLNPLNTQDTSVIEPTPTGTDPGDPSTCNQVTKSATAAQRYNERLPHSFSSQVLFRFDTRHDGNIVVAKEHSLYDSVAKIYLNWVKNVMRDLRCLGIAILQLYSICIFSPDEYSSLLHWHPPSNDAYGSDVAQQQHQNAGRNSSPTRSMKGGTGGGGKSAKMSSLASLSMKSQSTEVIKLSSPDGSTKTLAAGSRHHPTPTESTLVATYPCVDRMPPVVKKLLLEICFCRFEDALVETTLKMRGEMSTKFEFKLMPMLKSTNRNLNEMVDQMMEDAQHEKPVYWTEADHRAYLFAKQQQHERLAAAALQGPLNAQKRLDHEKYLLWYSLQPEDFKIRMEKKRKARIRAEKNTATRKKYIHLASHHCWKMHEYQRWIESAFVEYCQLLQEFRVTANRERKKSNKRPAIHINRLINDLLVVFTKTVFQKILAYRGRRMEEMESWAMEELRHLPMPLQLQILQRKHDNEEVGLHNNKYADSETGSMGSAAVSARMKLVMDNDGADTSLDGSSSNSIKGANSRFPAINSQVSNGSLSVALKKKAPEVVDDPSHGELMERCFRALARDLASFICKNNKDFRKPKDICESLRLAVEYQVKEAEAAKVDRILITSEEQLYFKRLGVEVQYLSTVSKKIRPLIVKFSDTIDLMDRSWIKFTLHLFNSAIMHRYHADEANRYKGENYAADRLIAFFRRIVIRNIISKVWQRTNIMFPDTSTIVSNLHSLRSVSSSSIGTIDSPAASKDRKTLRKKDLGGFKSMHSGSGDNNSNNNNNNNTYNSNNNIGSPAGTSSVGGGVSIISDPALLPMYRRKPFLVRDTSAIGPNSLHIELLVSIESDNVKSQALKSHKDHMRDVYRYDDWKGVKCTAFLVDEQYQHQQQQKTTLATAEGVRPTQQQQQSASIVLSNVTAKLSGDQPTKRRLVLFLQSKKQQLLESFSAGRQSPGHQSYPSNFMAMRTRMSVIQDLPPHQQQQPSQELQQGSAFGGTASVTMETIATGGGGGVHSAWDDRTLDSSAVNSIGVVDEAAGQPVIGYNIDVESILAFSSYTIEVIIDKYLAEDLKGGNQSFFERHFAEVEEAVGNFDNLLSVSFEDAGISWQLKPKDVPATAAVSHEDDAPQDIKNASRPSKLVPLTMMEDSLQMEIMQPVLTSASVPKPIEQVTVEFLYNSTDLQQVLSSAASTISTFDDADAASVVSSTGGQSSQRMLRSHHHHRHHLSGASLGSAELSGTFAHTRSSVIQETPLLQYLLEVPEKPSNGALSQSHLADSLHCFVRVLWAHSREDSRSLTHYEVQRRIVLKTKEVAAGSTFQPQEQQVLIEQHGQHKGVRHREEDLYVGPWKHVSGLKNVRSAAGASGKGGGGGGGGGRRGGGGGGWSISTGTAAGGGGTNSYSAFDGGTAMSSVSFPQYTNNFTDSWQMKSEFDSNPDAYNSIMGYLCAHFSHLVANAATNQENDVGHSEAANHSNDAAEFHTTLDSSSSNNNDDDDNDCESPQRYPQISVEGEITRRPQQQQAGGDEETPNAVAAKHGGGASGAGGGIDILHKMVDSNITIRYEYRVRAINSVGMGKFSAPVYLNEWGNVEFTPAHLKVAKLFVNLWKLCDVRSKHPKYRLVNSHLVTEVLQNAQKARNSQAVVIRTSTSHDDRSLATSRLTVQFEDLDFDSLYDEPFRTPYDSFYEEEEEEDENEENGTSSGHQNHMPGHTTMMHSEGEDAAVEAELRYVLRPNTVDTDISELEAQAPGEGADVDADECSAGAENTYPSSLVPYRGFDEEIEGEVDQGLAGNHGNDKDDIDTWFQELEMECPL